MATLQKLRNMGPLLIIFVGLALFAFIVGDAFKLFQPHQAQAVGEVNGEELSATDYQKMVEEYSDVLKARGLPSLTDDQLNQVRDEVWNSYVRNKLIEDEAEKIGLTVTAAELQFIVNMGTDQLLQGTPFSNEQTGKFDKDLLNNFLIQYEQNKDNYQFAEQYRGLYNYWKFIEKGLKQNTLITKYQNLISNSIISNPISAQAAFDARNEADVIIAAYPYSAISDTTITIQDSDLEKAYKAKKEQFKQQVETRDIKYVSFQVKPSKADNDSLLKEMNEYARNLENNDFDDELAIFMRRTNSIVPYAQVAWSKESFPEDVAIRLDSVAIGTVFGPYYNFSDESYNVFEVLSKTQLPDSIQYRQLAVSAGTAEATALLADSLMDALKGGANFEELAKKYGQQGTPVWISSRDYEGFNVIDENALFINTLTNMKKGERKLLSIEQSQAKVILDVLDTRNVKDKYLALVIKRQVDFSKETYKKAYNNFSQYVAICTTIEELISNAEESGYRVQELSNVLNNAHNIANIRGTSAALRWVFEAKEGDVSPLYTCGDNDNNLLLVALDKINKKGYQPMGNLQIQAMLRNEIIKDKKAKQIISLLDGDFASLSTVPNVKIDTLRRVSFAAPAYVGLTYSSEPAISAKVSIMEENAVSAPIQGNGGVYVVKVISRKPTSETFNAENEEKTLSDASLRSISRFLNELSLKADVVDNRYLFQ